MPLLGIALVLAGFVLSLLGRKKALIILAGLCLFDAGTLAFGLAFGGTAGGTGAALLVGYNVLARLLAFACLLSFSREGDLTGIGKARPVTGILFSFAMFAALGISPFLTTDAKPLIMFAGLQAQAGYLTALLVLANSVAAVLTVLLVHKIWRNGKYSYNPETWRPELTALRVPAVLALLLVAQGLFGHQLIHLVAGWFGSGVLPDFAVTWHPAVLLTYIGALVVFLLGMVHPTARNVAAALLPAAAFMVLWQDASMAPLGRFFGLVVNGIACLVTIYSWSYIHKQASNLYYALLLLMFGSLTGLATAQGLGGFFVFWEIMTLTSYVLVAWEDTAKAHAAAVKYFIMCSVAAAVMLPGLLMFQNLYGSLEIANLSLAVSSLSMPVLVALLLTLVGFGVKAGLFPGHSWLPDAHPAAPSSISAPLSGVLTKAGIIGIFLVFVVIAGGVLSQAPEVSWIVIGLGVATMLYGEIMALRQQDLKRLLAYSTMGQIGEITMTLGLFTWLATAGALMHVVNHAIMKDLLFLCSGALIMRAGARNLSDLRGLGKAMPFTATCMVIGLIAILGLPPFAGFMSKFMMLYALADVNPYLAGLLLLASLAGVVYYTRIIKVLIFEPYEGAPVKEAPWSMRVPMAVLAGLALLLGLFPQLSLQNMIVPVLNSLSASGKLVAQSLPSLTATWPIFSIVLLGGALVPVLLRKNAKAAGYGAALVLAAAAVLVVLGRGGMDTLSFIFALAVTVIGCANMLYSVGYMDHSHTQWRFFASFLCMCAGLTGVAASTDLFSFFLFWEIMSSWSLYFVIVHEESPEALREGFKYFFFNVLGAAFLFLGVVMAVNWCGGADFAQIRAALPALAPWQIGVFMSLMAIGLVMKAAQLPFRIDVQMHPAVAPTPVSGYISSVLLKSAIFGLIKLFVILGGGLAAVQAVSGFGLPQVMDAVVWIGGITIVMAAMFAVFQTDIKLVLIYSTVSQLGYMVVAVALGTSLGVAGGLLHLINHVFFKDLLFLVAGAVILRTHRQSMLGLGGLGSRMPVTLAMFCIGAICVIGLPPSSGFTSKWIIYHALMEQGFVLVAILSLVGSVLTLAYMTRFLHSVFLGQPARGLGEVKEAPKVMLIPMAFLALGCIVTSLFPGAALLPINAVLGEYSLPLLDVAPWGINSGTGAWNATLAALMVLTVWLLGSLILHLLNRRCRVTDIHTCGIPPEELTLGNNPADIYTTPGDIINGMRAKQTTSGS